MRGSINTATAEPVGKYYPDVAEQLLEIDSRLDTLRNMWAWADSEGKRELRQQAQELHEQRVDKQFRTSREFGYLHREPFDLAPALTYDQERKSDAEWLSWKVNKFISNISYRNKRGQLYLRAGRKSIALGGDSQYIEFVCYGCQHFQGRHYVGGNSEQAKLILSRILAHTYKH